MPTQMMYWIRVCLVSLGLTIVVALVAGMLFEIVGSARDAKRYPQVGTSYDVDGRRFNLHCLGHGSPTVILESGLGAPAYSWFKIQPELSNLTRVCSYDRAGYGWSDRATTQRDSKTIAQELHALLGTARVAPPYLFVGHSFGGFTARVFNALYPGEISSVVLVDSSHPDQDAYLPPELARVDQRQILKARFVPPAINIGMVRLMRLFGGFEITPNNVPPREREVLEYLIFQPKFFRAALGEMRLFDTVSADAVRASGNFGDKPLVVITAGKSYVENDYGFHRVWTGKLQPELLGLSTRSRQVFVPDSTHMIPYDRPDTVIGAVRELLGH